MLCNVTKRDQGASQLISRKKKNENIFWQTKRGYVFVTFAHNRAIFWSLFSFPDRRQYEMYVVSIAKLIANISNRPNYTNFPACKIYNMFPLRYKERFQIDYSIVIS